MTTNKGTLYDYDADVMLKGIMLSEACRRFLARQRTQQIIATGYLLDEDVVRDLVDASEAAHRARIARVQAARPVPSGEQGTRNA